MIRFQVGKMFISSLFSREVDFARLA